LLLLGLVEHAGETSFRGPQRDFAEGLDQATIGVVRETEITGRFAESTNDIVVHTEVEDRVHHTRHGHRSTGSDRDQQRILRIAVTLARLMLELLHVGPDLVHQPVGQYAPAGVILATRLGGDDESGGDRQPDLGHSCQSGALTPQQLFVLTVCLLELEHVFLRVHFLSSLLGYGGDGLWKSQM